jgi:hypothetical protein
MEKNLKKNPDSTPPMWKHNNKIQITCNHCKKKKRVNKLNKKNLRKQCEKD